MYFYQSNITQFLDNYLKEHPVQDRQRMINRSRLWDVVLRGDEEKGFKRSMVKTRPYMYQPFEVKDGE